MLGMLDDEKYENNNIAGKIGIKRAGFLVGLAGVLFLIFSVQFFQIMVVGNIHGVDLRAEINDKIHQNARLLQNAVLFTTLVGAQLR